MLARCSTIGSTTLFSRKGNKGKEKKNIGKLFHRRTLVQCECAGSSWVAGAQHRELSTQVPISPDIATLKQPCPSSPQAMKATRQGSQPPLLGGELFSGSLRSKQAVLPTDPTSRSAAVFEVWPTEALRSNCLILDTHFILKRGWQALRKSEFLPPPHTHNVTD